MGIPTSQLWRKQDRVPIPVPDSVQLSVRVLRSRPEITGSSKPVQINLTLSKTSQKVRKNSDRFVFQAGRLKEFAKEWQQLTSDPFILEMVCGSKIPVDDNSKQELNKIQKIRFNEISGVKQTQKFKN